MDSKLKRGKPVNSQSREIIYNVYLYFLTEANAFKKTENGYFNKVQDRVVKATGISRRFLQNLLNEKDKNGSSAFVTPKKGRPKKNFRLKLDNFDYSVIRNMVYDFYFILKEVPTIKSLQKKLFDAIGFQGCADTLKRILKDMGFRFMKTENNTRLLAEKSEVRLKRVEFIKQIQALRAAGKNIVYMEGSYVHTSHTKGKSCSVKDQKGDKQPITKGERIIIMHAGNEKGFIPGALMLGKCLDSVGDYNTEIHAETYHNWLRHQLIPNLTPNSVLVIDNAPHNTQLLDKAPSSNSGKPEMTAWLIQNNIPFDPEITKPELYKVIKVNKERLTEYTIDRILQDNGHSILRLPPFHPDFNPIENIWSQLKNYVADKNVVMNVTTVRGLLLEKVNMIGPDEWKNVCDHAVKCEDEYRKFELAFDSYLDSFIINGGYSSESGDSDSQMWIEATSDSD